ncbi:unnamed protein product [Rotaria magnacalcarata]|uniref:5'-nucleotidase n=1 Tax=Rotaria magnacalcarata TaxID=392030 RepID=A0A816QRG7_9BILA|nr:unnamed protein product [Rotaria magnacalcarata]CAF4226247.1 unnamed protein product [Rotaria magnacalcarata]
MPLSFKLVVCITSTALFDCSTSHEIWLNKGLEAYQEYQQANIEEPLEPGVGFPLVRSLLALNEATGKQLIDVVLVSRNDGESGERVRNSITHHKLPILRMSFTGGTDVTRYLSAWKCDLFLSTEENQVRTVLSTTGSDAFKGIAAGLVVPSINKTASTKFNLPQTSDNNKTTFDNNVSVSSQSHPWPEGQLRIVFDGDGVLFSDEAEIVYQRGGWAALRENEQNKKDISLPQGPMHMFAMKLQEIQKELGNDNRAMLRTFLVTSRDHAVTKRLFHTLTEWKLKIDEKHFVGGLDKTPFLRAIDPAIFFDDSIEHIERARPYVPTAYVIYGSKNNSVAASEIAARETLRMEELD